MPCGWPPGTCPDLVSIDRAHRGPVPDGPDPGPDLATRPQFGYSDSESGGQRVVSGPYLPLGDAAVWPVAAPKADLASFAADLIQALPASGKIGSLCKKHL